MAVAMTMVTTNRVMRTIDSALGIVIQEASDAINLEPEHQG